MASRFPMDAAYSDGSQSDRRRSSASSTRSDDPYYSRPQRSPQGESYFSQSVATSGRPSSLEGYEYQSGAYKVQLHQQLRNPDTWLNQSGFGSQGYNGPTVVQPGGRQTQVYNRGPVPNAPGPASRSSHSGGQASWPGPLLRRISSEDTSLSELAHDYCTVDMPSSVPGLPSKTFPQRRPSNRDEFDGPSQFLNKPNDNGFEPNEDDMPPLPVSLYAQEQDEILSQVNDRLSKCAFDFVAKYQFPIPIEQDKRRVLQPLDREWSEWVYLLKRLATKRRIPARVLYNGQIKQFITILENSLEMRHAAKHQSRPLKDDRNILQLISSGLQVAKIVKDAPAMQFLDSLYVQTERKIQGRRSMAAAASFGAATRAQ